MEDWLKRRLSPYKDSEPRWIAIAELLQAFWEENFDPKFQSLSDMRSIYTASQEDLKRRIRELGEYFQPDFPTEFDQPLAVAWRRAEIQRKDVVFILKSTFRRNFSGLDVEWVPLYAPKAEPYGSVFKTPRRIVGEESNYFLTSRGKVSADLGKIFETQRFTKSDFAAIVEAITRKIKPEHIVFDGVTFFVNINAYFEVEAALTRSVTQSFSIPYFRQYLYDMIPADARSTDSRSIAKTGESTELTISAAMYQLNTETYRYDEMPADVMPTDIYIRPYPV